MKRKLLIGILVVFGIAVTVLNPLLSGIVAVGVWIYLVRMVWKQKHSVFNDQMEQEITRWHLKRLKAFLLVAGISFLVFVFSSIAHNVVLLPISQAESKIVFWLSVYSNSA